MLSEPSTSSPTYVTYWENAAGQVMPPYVALALVSMQKALGEKLIILTPSKLNSSIDPSIVKKHWSFYPLSFSLGHGIEDIIAKSDYVRMAWIQSYGGVWLDADTLMFGDPTKVLFPKGLSAKLHWYDESIFGSLPGNKLLEEALHLGIKEDKHHWGNPGSIKDLVVRYPSKTVMISRKVIDPGYRPQYNFKNCDVMRRTDINVKDFLKRPVSMLKLYNTYYRRTSHQIESVSDFLSNGSLLAKLFLNIEPREEFWLYKTKQLMDQLI